MFSSALKHSFFQQDMNLANYLCRLWDATPGNLREMGRPTELLEFQLEGAATYLQTEDAAFWTEFQAKVAQAPPQLPGGSSDDSTIEELGMRPDLDRTGSGEDEFEFPDPPADDGSLLDPDESYLEVENDDRGRFTSNDRAFLKYHTVLGGPILNF
jgi:hypothetical protein